MSYTNGKTELTLIYSPIKELKQVGFKVYLNKVDIGWYDLSIIESVLTFNLGPNYWNEKDLV